MQHNVDPTSRLQRKRWIAALCAFAAPLLLFAAVRGSAERPHSLDTQQAHQAVVDAVKSSTVRLAEQHAMLEELRNAHRGQVDHFAEVNSQIQDLNQLLARLSEKPEGEAGTPPPIMQQIGYLHGRLARIEATLARLDADLHTPQLLHQTLERQKSLAKP